MDRFTEQLFASTRPDRDEDGRPDPAYTDPLHCQSCGATVIELLPCAWDPELSVGACCVHAEQECELEVAPDWYAFVQSTTAREREYLEDAWRSNVDTWVDTAAFRTWMMSGPGVGALERYRLQAKARKARAAAIPVLQPIAAQVARHSIPEFPNYDEVA